MNKYNVEIIETLSKVVEQEANSYEEAEDLVYDKYYDTEIILDYENMEDVKFKPYPPQEVKSNFILNVIYNKEKKELFIKQDKEVKTYKCRDILDLKQYLNGYLENNIELEPVKPEIDIRKNNKDYER